MSIIGINPERDSLAKRRIDRHYHVHSVGIMVVSSIGSLMGTNAGAMMKLRWSAKQQLKKQRQEAWDIYCETGDIEKAMTAYKTSNK